MKVLKELNLWLIWDLMLGIFIQVRAQLSGLTLTEANNQNQQYKIAGH